MPGDAVCVGISLSESRCEDVCECTRMNNSSWMCDVYMLWRESKIHQDSAGNGTCIHLSTSCRQ